MSLNRQVSVYGSWTSFLMWNAILKRSVKTERCFHCEIF